MRPGLLPYLVAALVASGYYLHGVSLTRAVNDQQALEMSWDGRIAQAKKDNPRVLLLQERLRVLPPLVDLVGSVAAENKAVQGAIDALDRLRPPNVTVSNVFLVTDGPPVVHLTATASAAALLVAYEKALAHWDGCGGLRTTPVRASEVEMALRCK